MPPGLTTRDPANFPGNPYPPAEPPEPAKPAPQSAGPATSGGPGALPPSKAAGATPLAPVAPSSKDATYSIVEGKNGTHDAYMSTPEKGDEHMGACNLPKEDLSPILAAAGGVFNPSLKIYEHVPEATIKACLAGRPAPADSWKAAWQLGEEDVQNRAVYSNFLSGKLTLDQAKLKTEPNDVKAQLAEAPGFAWSGLGKTAADILKHPIDTAKSALDGSVKLAARALPMLMKTGEGSMVGAVVGGGIPALMGQPELILPGARIGAQAGTLFSLLHLEMGGAAHQMAQKGYDETTIRTLAPVQGAVSAALWMKGVDIMAAPIKALALGNLAKSETGQKTIAQWAMDYAKTVGLKMPALSVVQSAVAATINDIAAIAEGTPEKLTSGREFLKQALQGAIETGKTAAILGIPGALLELPKKTMTMEKTGAGALPKEEVIPQTQTQEIEPVPNREFKVARLGSDKQTSTDIRNTFVGMKNEQVAWVNQLAEQVRHEVPKEDLAGLRWYIAAKGDDAVLQKALADPELKSVHAEIQQALELSPEGRYWAKQMRQYYEETGANLKEQGVIKNVRENYQARLYKPDKEGPISTELKRGVQTGTGHAMKRHYETEFDAVRGGKEFAGDATHALSVYGEEVARASVSRKMADAGVEAGVMHWGREAPEGWEQVGNLKKEVPLKDESGQAIIGKDGNQIYSVSKLYAPKGIAKGLKALTEPDWTKKSSWLRGIQRVQGTVKSADLSFSFFHHFTMVMQAVFQRDVSALMELGTLEKHLNSSEFKTMERHFTLHGGITSIVDANADILRNLTENTGDTLSKIANAPGVKQALELSDKSSNFLFGKLQRMLKVQSYARRMSAWIADNPEATEEATREAGIGYARHVNATYGGLNWEAMGIEKAHLSLMRLGLLAPDWTISNLQLLKQAIGEAGPAGNQSRAHILTALLGGFVLTEGLSKMLTGHYTDKNSKGHALEIEIAPHVYVSLLRGGIGDITKLVSMAAESGAGGIPRFLQGKLAPFPRTMLGLLADKDYTGRPIYGAHVPSVEALEHKGVPKVVAEPVANTYEVLKYVLANGGPMPFGISNLIQYTMGEKNPAITGGAFIGSGLGRYSKGKGSK